jgi:Fe-S oxidoreductase
MRWASGNSGADPARISPARSGPCVQAMAERCTGCNRCKAECAFLARYGNPGQIAAAWPPGDPSLRDMAFECSLCGYCRQVCPEDLDPGAMFLSLRRDCAAAGGRRPAGHARLINFERCGTSRRFTYYALPQGCDTVFFPGCALPGTRPERTAEVFFFMQQRLPALGIVLDCCTKPSHDLGRQSYFEALFGEMKSYLLAQGVRKILTACPSCHKVFRQYGAPLEAETVYEVLAAGELPPAAGLQGTICVHDPCAARRESSLQKAVRLLAGARGLALAPMAHEGVHTVCCGEGGAVGLVAGDLSRSWQHLRCAEAGGRRIITYCAGCTAALDRAAPASHLLDLLFEPEACMAGRVRAATAPLTYWNRLRLKRRMQRELPAAVTRERTLSDLRPAVSAFSAWPVIGLLLDAGPALYRRLRRRAQTKKRCGLPQK